MSLTAPPLAPALAGREAPRDDSDELRRLAGRLMSAGSRWTRAAEQLRRATTALAHHWHGDAADAGRGALGQLAAGADDAAGIYAEAAAVLLSCAHQLAEAQATWQRAQALERQDESDRVARREALLLGDLVSPYDLDGSALRRQARSLADEAHALADRAGDRAAAQLHELSERAPHPAPVATLSAADHASGFGQAAVDAAWGSLVAIGGLSLPRLVLDEAGWRRQVQELRDGAQYAAAHPQEAALAAVGWDLLQQGRYGEWAGTLLPDLASGVVSGGALPAGRRGAALADDLAERAEDVDDLQRVDGRRVVAPESTRGGPVRPAPGARMTPRYPKEIQDLDPERQRHILDGDPPEVRGGRGGGHRAGTGKPGKSEFPPSWTDDDIIRRVMDTARSPTRTADPPPSRTNLVAEAEHAGVLIKVVVDPDGRVITAYPLSGPGVIRNPRDRGR